MHLKIDNNLYELFNNSGTSKNVDGTARDVIELQFDISTISIIDLVNAFSDTTRDIILVNTETGEEFTHKNYNILIQSGVKSIIQEPEVIGLPKTTILVHFIELAAKTEVERQIEINSKITADMELMKVIMGLEVV